MINLLITERGSYGGSISYLCNFLKFLDKRKFNALVVFKHLNTITIKRIQELGFEVISLRHTNKKDTKICEIENNNILYKIKNYCSYLFSFLRNDIPEIIKLVAIIYNKKIDVVFLNADVPSFVSAVLAAKLTKVTCIVRKSGLSDNGSKKTRYILSKLVDLFISSSDSECQIHRQNKLPYKRMVTIYEGVDINSFSPTPSCNKIRDELGISPSQNIVCSVSRFDFGKGHFDLIQSARSVIDKLPNTIFLLVGDDLEYESQFLRKKFQEEVRRLGISRNIIFTGWRNDVSDILREVDIFVHCPLIPEGLCISVLEALACGKPTIVTGSGGLVETTKEDYNGFIIPKGDCKKLTEKIVFLLENRQLLEKMGCNSRIFAENNFDMSKNIKKIERLIFDTLGQN